MKPSDRFDSLIRYWSNRVDLPWELVKRQMLAESSGDPFATSRAGARGLMQLMPDTAVELGVRDPYNPDEAIRGGTNYLSRLRMAVRLLLGPVASDPDDQLRFALSAYNCGYAYVRRALRALLDQGLAVNWENFARELPRARVGNRVPRTAEVFAYVERVLPRPTPSVAPPPASDEAPPA